MLGFNVAFKHLTSYCIPQLNDAGMVVVSQKLGRKCTVPLNPEPVVCESIRASICRPCVETELMATKKSKTDGN